MQTCKKCSQVFSGKRCNPCRRLDYANNPKTKETNKRWADSNRDKVNLSSKKYYEKNKETVSAKIAEWKAVNKEHVKQVQNNYWISNREKCLAANKKYKDANKQKVVKYNKEYRVNNKDLIANYNLRNKDKRAAYHRQRKVTHPNENRIILHNRRARINLNGGKLSTGIARKLYQLQKGKCACCNNDLGDDYHLDHIMPIALGGTNSDSNVQLLTKMCNLQKHAKHPIDYMQSKGFLL